MKPTDAHISSHVKRRAVSLASLAVQIMFLAVITSASRAHAGAQSLGGAVEARVSSVRGQVVLAGNGRAASTLTRGVVLSPGDVLDTRGGGRITIALSDGSMVIVQSGSVVMFQDYRSAGSLRELLKITVGRVRVRINHFGGRPNPYRINSPTASIAVRGTEFSVAVEARGDTEVVVYEGLVEVASLTRPSRRVLVEPGHGVIIRPHEDIQFFATGPANEVGERTNSRRLRIEESAEDEEIATTGERRAGDSLRTAAGVYERYFESIVESGETPLPSRFTAFPDSHFDSMDNPSYATEFKTTEGRIFLLPSVGGVRENGDTRELLGFGDERPLDYSFSSQTSLFVPLPKYRMVVGGRFAYSRDGLRSFTLEDNVALSGSLFNVGDRGRQTVDGSTTNRFFTLSLVAARQLGSDGRTSLGVGLDYLKTGGSLSNTFVQLNGSRVETRERLESRSKVFRTRLTVGLTRELSGRNKLGIFYRQGFTSAEDRDLLRTLNDVGRRLELTSADAHSSEVGLRLRGPLTRRLFYGIEGSFLKTTTDETISRRRVVDSSIRARSTRATLGFGLGYHLRPRTVFGFDLAGGIVRINGVRREDATRSLLEIERKKGVFLSLHVAMQADIWRNLFVSGSVLAIAQSRVVDLMLYPDRFGRRRTDDGMYAPDGRTHDRFTDYFSNFGTGWRFNRNFLAEYIFSTDFGQTSSRHTLFLRYTFSRGGR